MTYSKIIATHIYIYIYPLKPFLFRFVVHVLTGTTPRRSPPRYRNLSWTPEMLGWNTWRPFRALKQWGKLEEMMAKIGMICLRSFGGFCRNSGWFCRISGWSWRIFGWFWMIFGWLCENDWKWWSTNDDCVVPNLLSGGEWRERFGATESFPNHMIAVFWKSSIKWGSRWGYQRIYIYTHIYI